MSSIFLVILASGRYDSTAQRVVRAFGKLDDAETFASDRRDAIGDVAEKHNAMSVYMSAWDSKRVYPGYEAPASEREAYAADYTAEADRIQKLFGLGETECGFTSQELYNYSEYFDVSVQEVPFES
jgi:hypothetical protein